MRLGFSGAEALAKSLSRNPIIEVAGSLNRSHCPATSPRRRGVRVAESIKELARMDLDGLVVGPSAPDPLEQIAIGLEAGVAVFCQRSPSSSVNEVHQIVGLARRRDRLLTCDFPYRRLTGVSAIPRLMAKAELGTIFALDFAFHCAGRPQHPWLTDAVDRGCLAECGIHMLDLALWCVGYPEVTETWGRLVSEWEERGVKSGVEGFAAVRLILQSGVSIQVSCSRKLPPGCPAVIHGAISGTKGTVEFHNLPDSLTHFSACHIREPRRDPLPAPLRFRAGEAVIEWAKQLARNPRFDPSAERLISLAEILGRLPALRDEPT